MKSPIHSESAGTGMIFVEGFRLLFVLAGSAAGFEIGRWVDGSKSAPVIGLMLGAAISYVLGGVAGRLVDKGLQRAVFLFRNTPAGEIFAASIVATTGMLLGLVVGLPLLVLFRSGFALLDHRGGRLGPGLTGVEARFGQGTADRRRRPACPESWPPSRTRPRVMPSWSTARPSWTGSCWCSDAAGCSRAGWCPPVRDGPRPVGGRRRPTRSPRAGPGVGSSRSRPSGRWGSRCTSPRTRCPRSTTRPSNCSPWPAGSDCGSGPAPPSSWTRPPEWELPVVDLRERGRRP